jgi:hypothetical protein
MRALDVPVVVNCTALSGVSVVVGRLCCCLLSSSLMGDREMRIIRYRDTVSSKMSFGDFAVAGETEMT